MRRRNGQLCLVDETSAKTSITSVGLSETIRKGAARRSPKPALKTIKTYSGTRVSVLIAEILWKKCFPARNKVYYNILLKPGNRLLCYGQKTIFNIAAARHLEFKENYIWSHDCHRIPNVLLCTKFHQNRMTFRWDIVILRSYDLTIFKMADVRRPEFYGSKNGLFEKPM